MSLLLWGSKPMDVNYGHKFYDIKWSSTLVPIFISFSQGYCGEIHGPVKINLKISEHSLYGKVAFLIVNINIAEQKGWETIHFDRNNGHDIDYLIKMLKEKAILPQNFCLD